MKETTEFNVTSRVLLKPHENQNVAMPNKLGKIHFYTSICEEFFSNLSSELHLNLLFVQIWGIWLRNIKNQLEAMNSALKRFDLSWNDKIRKNLLCIYISNPTQSVPITKQYFCIKISIIETSKRGKHISWFSFGCFSINGDFVDVYNRHDMSISNESPKVFSMSRRI